MNNDTPVLVDENIEPNELVLKNVLKKVYIVYESFVEDIKTKDFNLNIEWKYYKDGKSWLCKVTDKKRTIFWLTVWKEYFTVTFYFTEKFDKEIESSGLSENIIKQYFENKPIGKLKPVTIKVDSAEVLTDVKKLIQLRK